MTAILLYNVRLVDASIDDYGAVYCVDGSITSVFFGTYIVQAAARSLPVSPETRLVDGGGMVLMPAFVDMHAHFRHPGQPYKEDLESALNAAAAGGFGTLVLMANTIPIISTAAQAQKVVQEAAAFSKSKVIQAVSITKELDGSDISHLENLNPGQTPVVSEDGRDVASAAVMLEAMKKCAKSQIILSCHCEDATLALEAKKFRDAALHSSSVAKTERLLSDAGRLLALAEDTATIRNLSLAQEAACHVHIAHVSTRESIRAIGRSKQLSSSFVSCEVTPHHLALTKKITDFVNPPLRSEDDRLALIDAIIDGTVDVIATDHAPHSQQDKAQGAPGFSGLETAFAVCYSTLVQGGKISLSRLSELMSSNPAKRLNLACGRFKPGYAADFVLVHTETKWKVNSDLFYSKGKNSPFNGMDVIGKVLLTVVGGRIIFDSPDRLSYKNK